MPIEIRELVIRATVMPSQTQGQPQPALNEQIWEELVAACVDRVIGIMRQQRER